jgi:hypothetical protein
MDHIKMSLKQNKNPQKTQKWLHVFFPKKNTKKTPDYASGGSFIKYGDFFCIFGNIFLLFGGFLYYLRAFLQ